METEGKKFDNNKVRMDLLPVEPIKDIAEILTFGADKYGDRNWEKGIAWNRVYGATLRHLTAWWNGENLDPETGKSHLAHAGCNILFLLEFINTHQELDNRPNMKKEQKLFNGLRKTLIGFYEGLTDKKDSDVIITTESGKTFTKKELLEELRSDSPVAKEFMYSSVLYTIDLFSKQAEIRQETIAQEGNDTVN